MAPDAAHAVLTIDLGAIVANWRLLQAKHSSGAAGAVVKADGYGLGARPVAEALAAAGCRHFFVASPNEALTLRPSIPDAQLVVLGGLFSGAEQDFAAHGIIPALGSLAEIDAWSRLARRLDRALPAFLHFDTGMSRLGLDARECAVLAEDHGRLTGIDVRCIMSHLVSSEAPDDPINALQRDRFNAIRALLPAAPASLVNSSGIFLGEGFGFDLARPGAALYGINPTPGRPNPMRPTVNLTARVLAVRDIPAGATAGYSATWTARVAPAASRPSAVGYADGWHRSHSNAGIGVF